MYAVSEEFSKQIKANNREFSVALTFNSSTELTGTTIQKIAVDEVVNSTDVLTFGCACSHKATINLIDAPKNIDYKNSYFTARIGLKLGEMPTRYEDVPLGKFYVTDVQTTDDFKNVTITAFDGFCKMTGTYSSTIKGKTTLQAVYDDLKTQLRKKYGIVLKAATLPGYEFDFSNIEDITYQQAIGYVAGCIGGFARFDRYGELEIAKYYDTGVTITREEQYMGGFKKLTDNPLQITSIATGTKNNTIVQGDGASGVSINFENPYITEAMAAAIYDEYNSFTYTPCQVKWRGNPAIQAGDIVHVIDSGGTPHTVLVMSQSIKIGGGLHSVVECKGKSEATSKFSNNFSPTSQKIDRVYKTLEQAIINATKAITGNSGGYVVLHDKNEDGCPEEILVMDNPNKENAKKIWRWNTAGLGFSENGYNGTYRTAITADGQINADLITLGHLDADLIYIGDEKFGDFIKIQDGVIRFGNADNPMSLKLGNVEVDGVKSYQLAFFAGEDRIAYFTSNSFEIENLDNGNVRFGDFGYILRKSGNLTFTKLT